jgi:hypothetical protein
MRKKLYHGFPIAGRDPWCGYAIDQPGREEEGWIVRSLQKNLENHLHGMNPKHLYMMLCQRCHAAKGMV